MSSVFVKRQLFFHRLTEFYSQHYSIHFLLLDSIPHYRLKKAKFNLDIAISLLQKHNQISQPWLRHVITKSTVTQRKYELIIGCHIFSIDNKS